MSGAPKTTLHVSHNYAQAPERVFDAWLDPKTAGKWLFTTPNGVMTRVEIDGRVGGKFTIVRRDGEEVEHVGEYLAVDRPRRLVFTFGVPKFSSEMTRVTIEIAPSDQGCALMLTQEDVLSEWAERSAQGWGMILDKLDGNLA